MIGPEDAILVLNTGSGLKDVGAAMKAVHPAPIIEPTLEAVEKELDRIDLSN
jgi:threonine synthase